jgi:hypothetical protein
MRDMLAFHSMTPEKIFGFTPVTPEAMSNVDVIDALKSHVVFPGQVRDDTAIFHRAQELAGQGYRTQVYVQPITVSRRQLDDIRSSVVREVADSPLLEKTYSFPHDAPFNCAPYNCATWPSTHNIPIPEPSGNMRDYIEKLKEIGFPWIRR